MDRTDVRCEGCLTENEAGGVACSLDLRCRADQLMRSYYPTGDKGVLQRVRDAHPDWHPSMGPEVQS